MPAVYLIPAPLHEATLPGNADELLAAVRRCQVLFAENERSARRYLKQLDRGIVIDDFEWHTIHKAETVVQQQLRAALRAGKTVGILSEAGCPGGGGPRPLRGGGGPARGVGAAPARGPPAAARPGGHPSGGGGGRRGRRGRRRPP